MNNMSGITWRRLLIHSLEMYLLLQVLDVLTTIVGIEGAGLMEGNTIPLLAMQSAGWLGLATLKIGAIFVGLLNFLVGIWLDPVYRGFRLPMLAVFALINVFGVVVVVWNIVHILSAIE